MSEDALKVISSFPLSQHMVNPECEMFSTVCLYLGNTDRGRVNPGKACVTPAARALEHSRGVQCGRAHICHLQGCQGPRAIDHIGLAIDMLRF